MFLEAEADPVVTHKLRRVSPHLHSRHVVTAAERAVTWYDHKRASLVSGAVHRRSARDSGDCASAEDASKPKSTTARHDLFLTLSSRLCYAFGALERRFTSSYRNVWPS